MGFRARKGLSRAAMATGASWSGMMKVSSKPHFLGFYKREKVQRDPTWQWPFISDMDSDRSSTSHSPWLLWPWGATRGCPNRCQSRRCWPASVWKWPSPFSPRPWLLPQSRWSQMRGLQWRMKLWLWKTHSRGTAASYLNDTMKRFSSDQRSAGLVQRSKANRRQQAAPLEADLTTCCFLLCCCWFFCGWRFFVCSLFRFGSLGSRHLIIRGS